MTKIRQLYNRARNSVRCHREQDLRKYLANPQEFVDICLDSHQELERRSMNQSWLPKLPRPSYLDTARHCWPDVVKYGFHAGFEVVYAMKIQERFSIEGASSLDFRYVEEQVGARPGSGRMDAMLVAEDGMPVAAEIKAPGDTDMFLCLVQGLMYAIELSTADLYQTVVRTLKDKYTIEVPTICRKPFVDLYLFVVEEEPPLYRGICDLVAASYKAQPSLESIVRRTVCLHPVVRDDVMRLNFRFAFGQGFSQR